jgi:GT2 family glycosyltransferase
MQVKGTRVSVIVVNFNGMPHIDACLSSVLKQTYSNFEVIFVDNNSSDGSLEYVRSKFPRLVIVASNENLGYAGGINAGLVHATGSYIAPLNMDTEVSVDWLRYLVSFLDENAFAGAVTPKVLLFHERDTINAMGLNIHVSGLGFCRSLGKKDNNSTLPEKVSGVSGCSYLIRRELLERMGGLPQECFMANDDVVVSWLVHLMGYETYCVPLSVAYHKYNLKMNPEKFFLLESNRYVLLLTALKIPTLVICFPVFALTELLIMGYCLCGGMRYINSKYKAFLFICRERRHIRERRSQVQKLRRVSDFQMLRKLKLNLEWGQLLQIA